MEGARDQGSATVAYKLARLPFRHTDPKPMTGFEPA